MDFFDAYQKHVAATQQNAPQTQQQNNTVVNEELEQRFSRLENSIATLSAVINSQQATGEQQQGGTEDNGD